MTTTTDYYALLGVGPDATLAQIKKAYRKLARQHHPDTNPGDPQAATRFRDIIEAYETLTDPNRREAHDRTRPKTKAPPTGSNLAEPGADSRAASILVQVLEDTWLAVRRRHQEIPAVVIILASGTETRRSRWGHFASGRLQVCADQRAEVMISGEALRLTPAEVLAVILHEAAHALAHSRGIKDSSRQGRYHNKQFKLHAEQLGLTVEYDQRNGWSASKITHHAEQVYASQIDALAEAMTLWRRAETTGPATRRNTNLLAASCPCGRSIRVAASTLAEAPITCQACDGDFQAKTPADA
jgi:curved DNA-binding protein CbpA